MPSKKRRIESEPPRPRKKRDHPKVEQFMAVSQLATIIANLAKQEQQYIALLKQVAEVTEHEARVPENKWFTPTFQYSEENAADIFNYVQRWLQTITEHSNAIREKRDHALDEMRKIDVTDDDSLKQAAMELTEAETQFALILQVQKRWSKIVRHEKQNDLKQHTGKWLKRWLSQWKKIYMTTQTRSQQFKESLNGDFVHSVIEA